MKAPHRILLAAVLGATLFAAAARAELTFTVNDNSAAGVFDQPSVAMHGATTHVAFIGAAGPTGPFRVYYAAINGSADFSNLTLARGNFLTTPQTAVDNAAAGNDLYYDARHPVIAVRSATEAVIFFQAKPSSASDPAYALYRARIVLDNNLVVEQRVNLVSGIPAGDVEDVSFALLAADNSARIAYSTRASIASADPFQVAFARVGLDNAAAAAPVAVTASYRLSQGHRPLPSVKLDDRNRAHVAWAATDASGTTPGPVYYAMIKETNGVDNMVIAPTAIMSRYFMRYSFPSVLVVTASLITVVAADEVSGNLGYVQINPDEARQNGMPGWDNISNNNRFLPVPPGEVILGDNFRLYRPEAFYESSSGRIFVTGYGTAGATFLAMKLSPGAYSADIVTGPTTFGSGHPPSWIDNDYTRAAFGFPGGRAVVFWSGIRDPENTASTDRDLYFTSVATVAAWISQNESGCSMVSDPARGAAGRIPGALLLFLPAAVLAARRFIANRGRRPADRGTINDFRRASGRTIGR